MNASLVRPLWSDGVSAFRARLRDATLEHHATRSKHPLLREQQPGLLRDCADAMGVPLNINKVRQSTEQVRAAILRAVEAHISHPVGMAAMDSLTSEDLQRLPKDPLKREAMNFDAPGANSLVEIMLCYRFPTNNNTCALTKEAMIESIRRHQARLEYERNLEHNAWRNLRETK